jgi:hypothetical protein
MANERFHPDITDALASDLSVAELDPGHYQSSAAFSSKRNRPRRPNETRFLDFAEFKALIDALLLAAHQGAFTISSQTFAVVCWFLIVYFDGYSLEGSLSTKPTFRATAVMRGFSR